MIKSERASLCHSKSGSFTAKNAHSFLASADMISYIIQALHVSLRTSGLEALYERSDILVVGLEDVGAERSASSAFYCITSLD